jgi:hypothetical protein
LVSVRRRLDIRAVSDLEPEFLLKCAAAIGYQPKASPAGFRYQRVQAKF